MCDSLKKPISLLLKSSDYKTFKALRKKVESILEVKSDFYDKQFIETVLKDYNYFTQGM